MRYCKTIPHNQKAKGHTVLENLELFNNRCRYKLKMSNKAEIHKQQPVIVS